MIKHLTWISAWSEARREARVKPTEAERPGIFLSKLFLLSFRLLFLSWKPTGVSVQIAFRPAYLTAVPRAHIFN